MVKYENGKATNVRIAYIGGGSRGWAWGFMSDLVKADDISGDVYLYDIDEQAAKNNEIIGNKFNDAEGANSHWNYKAVPTLEAALTGADFVIISIQPATFEEMGSDVHTPEKYGIYQSVGDSTGPGGVIRSLRTIPMYEVIAEAVRDFCPDAWVINYTNPMTVCTRTLYRVFPQIKAFGCCHEVFGTQKILAKALAEFEGIENVQREDIKVNVIGVNHFTWLTSARYKNIDIYPVYEKFCEKYHETGYGEAVDQNWMNKVFSSRERVKMDLFRRYGIIAAAGDRHLAEFCEGTWYLKDPETVASWLFELTPISFRKKDLERRLARSAALVSGEEKTKIEETGEDGVKQIRALLGLHTLITNVNIPNKGQIPNLPYDAVVETNAVFRENEVRPVFAGNIPDVIYPLIARISGEQELINKAGADRDLETAFRAFVNDPLVTVSHGDARKLFDEMVDNTKAWLTMYNK